MKRLLCALVFVYLATFCNGCGAQYVSLSGNGVQPPTPALTLSSSSIAFGNVFLLQTSTQTLTMTSTGNAPVTITGIAISGPEFSMTAPALPLTLNPQASSQVQVSFAPTVAGGAAGGLQIISNALTSPVQSVTLAATGQTHEVDLAWQAPTGGTDPVVGYNAYRAVGSTGIYHQINTALITGLTYADTTVASGQNYTYIVESVDAQGNLSAPSNMTAVTIP